MKEEKNNLSENIQMTLIKATSEIVSSYIKTKGIERKEIPTFIEEIYSNLISINEKTKNYILTPYTTIEDSIKEDYLICLEDGKKLKMLKRYLKSKYNMTEKEYKEKWGLSKDYPMIAPSYAKKRKNIAKTMGLGKRKNT